MKIESRDIFRELEPPPGGVSGLRARLGARPGSRGTPFVWLGPAAVAAVAAALVFAVIQRPATETGSTAERLMAAAEFDRLLGRTSVPYELSVRLGNEPIEVVMLDTGDSKVRIYRLVEDASGLEGALP